MNRKEFIRKGFQLSILSGMLIGTGFLINRKQVDFTCSEDQQCKACSKYRKCDLDKAITNRKNER